MEGMERKRERQTLKEGGGEEEGGGEGGRE